MHAIIHTADMQDHDGDVLMASLFALYPLQLKLSADVGYQGEKFQACLKAALKQVKVEIVKRSDQAKGFGILPKHWVAERTFHGLTVADALPRIGKISTGRQSTS